MSSVPQSPGVESPLSMLASVVSDAPHEQGEILEIDVQLYTLGSIKLGTHSDTLTMFVFPYGVYFSLEQLGNVITAKKSGYAQLYGDLPKYSILKDVKTKTIYLSQNLIEYVADEQQGDKIRLLSQLSVQDLKNKLPTLANLTGLFPAQSLDPLLKTIQVVPFKPQPARYPGTLDRKRSFDDGREKGKNNKRLSIETRFAEKMENNTEMVDQLKSSYIVKQQQQAIIDQRTRILIVNI